MKTTTNYGLKKPDGTDVVNIDDFNSNADIIDAQLKANANNIASNSNEINILNGQLDGWVNYTYIEQLNVPLPTTTDKIHQAMAKGSILRCVVTTSSTGVTDIPNSGGYVALEITKFKNGSVKAKAVDVSTPSKNYEYVQNNTGTGNTWIKLSTTDKIDISSSFVNGWTPNINVYGTPFALRNGDLLTLNGFITIGTKTANTQICTLPVGFRPSSNRYVMIPTFDAYGKFAGTAYFAFYSSGQVKISTFDVESNSYSLRLDGVCVPL